MNHQSRALLKGILFLVFFFLIFWQVNPTLVFHFQQLSFKWDNSLINYYLSYPGGLIEYFSIFLFQFSKFAFWGAFVYLLLAILIVYMHGVLLTSPKQNANTILKYSLILFIAALIGNYAFPLYFLVNIFLLLTLLVVYRFFSRNIKNYSLELIVTLVYFSMAYFLLGGGVFILFALSALLIELFQFYRVKYPIVVFIPVLTLAILLITANVSFFISPNNSLLNFIPFGSSYKPTINVILFYALVPFSLLIQVLFTKIKTLAWQHKRLELFQYFLLIVAMVVLFWSFQNKELKFQVEVDNLAFKGKWDKIIEKVDKHPSTNRLINFHTNRALYHTGQMPYKLFHYPQQWGTDGLYLLHNYTSDFLLPSIQLYVDMAYTNEAIYLANELILQKENSPQIIEQLIVSHIIEGNYKSAMLHVNNLKKFPFFKKQAQKYETMISSKQADEWMLKKRSFIPVTDFAANRQSPEFDLYQLLVDHPKNKIVYEYLMSYYLLNNDMKSFFTIFPIGFNFKYDGIPRVYQEALTYYLYKLNMEGGTIPNIKIDDEILSEFSDFISILIEFENSAEHAKQFLTKFKNTYWYYIYFESPVTLNRKND